jgi:hypothetical protein
MSLPVQLVSGALAFRSIQRPNSRERLRFDALLVIVLFMPKHYLHKKHGDDRTPNAVFMRWRYAKAPKVSVSLVI